MKIEIIKGKVKNLERSTEQSGGRNTQVSTTHVLIFNIDNTHVQLRNKHIEPISNEDEVEIAGIIKNGVCHAVICKNITKNHITSRNKNGAKMIFMGLFVLFSLLFGPLAIIATPLAIYLFYITYSNDREIKKAEKALGI